MNRYKYNDNWVRPTTDWLFSGANWKLKREIDIDMNREYRRNICLGIRDDSYGEVFWYYDGKIRINEKTLKEYYEPV